MRTPLPPLDALEAFEAAARFESFARAGEALHLSASAISHRIKALEAHLGHRLFHRLAHGVRLTDRGTAYLPVVRDLFDELAGETAAIFERPPRGRIAVRVPVSYGSLFLAPRLGAFTERTSVRVDLLSVIWERDAVDREIDFEIRLSPPPRDGADEIAPEVAIVVAHPDGSSDGLELVRVLGYENWTAQLETNVNLRAAPLAVDTWAAAVAMVEAHRSLCALVPAAIAAEPIRLERVVLGPAGPVSMRSRYWLAASNARAMQRPVIFEFVSWLRSQHAELSLDA